MQDGSENIIFTCELNLCLQPPIMQAKLNLPPCVGTCFSSHDFEQEVLPCTLQPAHRHRYTSSCSSGPSLSSLAACSITWPITCEA